MDGFTMLEQIKKLENNHYTPMVIFSTEKSDALKLKGRQIGVKAWLVKPFNEEKFISSIRKLVQ